MILFYITRWKYIYRRFAYWLDAALPAQCPQCGGWQPKRDMDWAEHRIGGWVQICQRCHKDLYGE